MNVYDIMKNIQFENNTIKTILPSDYSTNSNTDYLEKDFFLVALRALVPQLSNNVFLPDLSFGEDYFITINLVDKTLEASQKLIGQINTNLYKYDLFVIPIQIIFPDFKNNYDISPNTLETTKNTNIGHANFVIIDKLKSTIELFEPHGFYLNHPVNIFDYHSELHQYIIEIFPNLLYFSFINSANSCILGVQTIQNSMYPQGSCLGWSLYMIFMRIINNNITITTTESVSEYIHRYMIYTFSASDLNIIINKFISFSSLVYLNYIQLHKVFDKTYKVNMNIVGDSSLDRRLRKLIKLYLYKLTRDSFKDCNKIFIELYSYINYRNFHKLFSNELKNYNLHNYFQMAIDDIIYN